MQCTPGKSSNLYQLYECKMISIFIIHNYEPPLHKIWDVLDDI